MRIRRLRSDIKARAADFALFATLLPQCGVTQRIVEFHECRGMCDMARNTAVRVFANNDPRQHAFRVKVAKMNDRAIVELEDDLARYAQTGLMSHHLQRILEDTRVAEPA